MQSQVKVSLLKILFSLLHKQLVCSKLTVVLIGHCKQISYYFSF